MSITHEDINNMIVIIFKPWIEEKIELEMIC